MSATPEQIAERLEMQAASVESTYGAIAGPTAKEFRAAAALIRAQAERVRVLEEALRDAVDVAGRHRRVALDYKYGTKAGERLPTDREWDALRDRVAAALRGAP